MIACVSLNLFLNFDFFCSNCCQSSIRKNVIKYIGLITQISKPNKFLVYSDILFRDYH